MQAWVLGMRSILFLHLSLFNHLFRKYVTIIENEVHGIEKATWKIKKFQFLFVKLKSLFDIKFDMKWMDAWPSRFNWMYIDRWLVLLFQFEMIMVMKHSPTNQRNKAIVQCFGSINNTILKSKINILFSNPYSMV